MSVCSTDGQRFNIGDVDDYFSIQSTSKVVTFAMALAEVGEKETLSYVGASPPGVTLRATSVALRICCLQSPARARSRLWLASLRPTGLTLTHPNPAC